MLHAPFSNASDESTRAGHIIGITGVIGSKKDQYLKTMLYEVESNWSSITIKYLNEKLSLYNPNEYQAEWAIIKSVFSETEKDVEKTANTSRQAITMCDEQLDRYNQGKPILICTGWSGHDFSVVFYKGYMIITNRGSGGTHNEGSIVYKLKNNLTATDINEIQMISHSHFTPKNRQEIQSKLKSLAQEQVASFPQKPQKKGTCSYVNKLAAVEGMHCLLTLDKEQKLNDSEIRKYAANNTRSAYKDFTRFCRQSEVERVLYLIEDAQSNQKHEQLSVMVNIAFKMIEKMKRKDGSIQKFIDETSNAEALLAKVLDHKSLLTAQNKACLSVILEEVKTKEVNLPSALAAGLDYLPLNQALERLNARVDLKDSNQTMDDILSNAFNQAHNDRDNDALIRKQKR